MKLNVFALILSVLFATAAQAERVIVIMKDQESFSAAHQEYKMKGSYALKGFRLKGKSNALSQVEGRVEDSLVHLNTLIIDTKNESQIEKLKANPAVAYVEKEVFHEAPRPTKGYVAQQLPNSYKGRLGKNTPWGINAVKAPQAWRQSKRGMNARVLVLDTGIDANHPSLKVNFEKGQDFTGVSDGSDFSDKNGHGTHCAGTIAGVLDKDGFTGVAPEAKILAGRVCGDKGCSNIAIAQGINWGISEGVDVISMSLGGAWSTPAERDAVSKADKAGITVVAASGNSGVGRVSYPAALPSVIAVGAIDVKLAKADFSQWGPELAVVAPGVDVISSVPVGSGREAFVSVEGKKVNSSAFQGAREILTPETNVLVHAGLGKEGEFTSDVVGKYALISRGEITFADKVKNAIKAGAAGVVIYNNAPGLLQGALTDDGSLLPIGVFMVEQTVGQEILASLQAGNAVSVTLQTLATDYSSFNGTSMATPHVAGVVALMKSANKALTGSQVKAILKNTAQALGPNDNNEFGAGLVNAQAAVQAAVDAR